MIYKMIGQAARRAIVGLLGVFFVASTIVPALAEDPAKVKVKPAIWQIEKNGSKTYLLGSFHLLPQNYDWFDGIISTSFDGSEQLVMESEMTPNALAEIQALVIKNGSFSGDDNLKNHLDDAHYQKLLKYSKSLMGLDETTAQKMKPWFMAINLSVVAIMSNGMDPNSGVDKVLESKARARGIAVSGLETAGDAMMALIDHPMPVQTAMLSETLDQLDDFKNLMQGYLDAWGTGDGDKIASTMLEDMKKFQGMYDALLVNRNNNWMPAIEAYINGNKNTFIVVGAAHLVGPDGIVKTLRSKGYAVEKIQ